MSEIKESLDIRFALQDIITGIRLIHDDFRVYYKDVNQPYDIKKATEDFSKVNDKVEKLLKMEKETKEYSASIKKDDPDSINNFLKNLSENYLTEFHEFEDQLRMARSMHGSKHQPLLDELEKAKAAYGKLVGLLTNAGLKVDKTYLNTYRFETASDPEPESKPEKRSGPKF